MRIVDAKDFDPTIDPEPHYSQQLLEQSEPIRCVEVDRKYILVFLGRVLRVLDAAVGPVIEPIRMFLDPWMIGRALHCEVERDLEAEAVGRRDEVIKVVERAERRLDSSMATRLAADCPRTAGGIGAAAQRIARALAIGVADRMDRRQIHDVE